MTEQWHPKVSYREGERCKYAGEVFEARFDLTRGLKPVGPLSEKFWRRVSIVPPVKANGISSGKKPTGYLTRAMGFR
ncbi:MAG: hypothetical protein EOS52_23710 [Mesorhizobium sp.]|uniref:hypothetical protein n=1 Tax=Mesorhizobium sp. TaxID=1871066 RepID=UPI000FE65BA3|nr:hypothetical protein [Mesorhizobium sp.]RWC10779.1 MAG: hypothetical protein EOS52_23710 [Mesorhizobium sp.]